MRFQSETSVFKFLRRSARGLISALFDLDIAIFFLDNSAILPFVIISFS